MVIGITTVLMYRYSDNETTHYNVCNALTDAKVMGQGAFEESQPAAYSDAYGVVVIMTAQASTL